MRRRLVLRLLLGAAACVCLVSMFNYVGLPYSSTTGFTDAKRRAFAWDVADSPRRQHNCRNTVQGAQLVTDDRGYTCRRENVDAITSCCAPSNTTVRYSCRGCMQPGLCCDSYEYCVGCCLRPEELSYLRQLVANARSLLLTMVEDTFELCMAACRTSSRSVIHENTYINNQYKFCVQQPPDPRVLQQPVDGASASPNDRAAGADVP